MEDLVETMMAAWMAEGADVVLVDPGSRHAAGRTGDPPTEPELVARVLDESGALVLQPGTGSALAQALVAVQVLRTWTGHPEWIVLDDAQDLLADTDLPPEGLRLQDGGYCLVRRRSTGDSCTLLPRV